MTWALFWEGGCGNWCLPLESFYKNEFQYRFKLFTGILFRLFNNFKLDFCMANNYFKM